MVLWRVSIAWTGLLLAGTATAQADTAATACAALDARALRVEAQLLHYRSVDGRAAVGDVSSVWRAWFDGRALVHLVEHQAWGEYGQAQAWYWFEDGRLFRYEERGQRGSRAPGGTHDMQAVDMTLWFGPEGQVLQASQSCDGVDVVPVEPEVHAAMHHAALLQTEAVTAMRAQRANARFFCSGTEPDWSVEIIGRRLRYAAPGETAQVFAGSGGWVDEAQTLFQWRGQAAGDPRPLTAWVQRSECGDGSSDRVLPLTGALRLPGGARHPPGCCDSAPPPALLAPLPLPRRVAYSCREGPLDVWFMRGGDTAVMDLDGESLALERVPSDAGARYFDGGVSFLAQADSAFVERAGQRIRTACRSVH